MRNFWRYVTAGVGFAVLVTLVLLATGWGSAVASSISSVLVTNTASNPVPVTPTGTVPVHEQGTAKVAEQNLDGSGNIKVHEQGTANVNVTNTTVPVSGSVGISGTPSVSISGTPSVSLSGTPSVNVSNFPAAPRTSEIGSGTVTLPGNPDPCAPSCTSVTLVNLAEVSADREVTLYIEPFVGDTANCFVRTFDSGNRVYILDSFSIDGTGALITKTYDPAPLNIQVICVATQTTSFNMDWMLTGRTG